MPPRLTSGNFLVDYDPMPIFNPEIPVAETAALLLPAYSFGGDLDDNVSLSFSLPDVSLNGLKQFALAHPREVMKFGLAIPAAVGLLYLLSTGSAEAGSLPQGDNPFNFPVELGDGALSGFLETSINSPVDSAAGMGVVGGLIGTIRLILQAPGIWNQLTAARKEGQAINYSAVLTRMGGLFWQNTVSEGMQWARLPLLIAATYWFNEMASYAPSEIASMFRMTALIMAGVTLVSTIEALDPFR